MLLLIIGANTNVNADEKTSGKDLHDKHCEGCHANMLGGDGSLLYTRDNRRVKDMSALQNQVQRCETRLGLKWFQDDIEKVVIYLNDNFYKFPAQ
jgi:mono/diheme cytochrome c family protein